MPTKTSSTKNTSPVRWSQNKKSDSKKVVVKRRTSDLTPTKASAAAIVARAQRVKNQESGFESHIVKKDKDTKIPMGVRVFFWCAMLLFSVAFYKAIINPQLDVDIVDKNVDNVNSQNVVDLWNSNEGEIIAEQESESENLYENEDPTGCIISFFDRLSNQDFDGLFQMLDGSLQRSQEMKDHFTSFRISPFLAWIQWNKVEPKNIQYKWKTVAWNDEYNFDLSYVLVSNNVQYDESWKVIIKNIDWNLKIASIMCETPKCSFHPIFWPENFGLMR